MESIQSVKKVSLDLEIQESLKNWKEIIRQYQVPDSVKASIQMLNSFIPFIGLWILMYFSLNWSILLTIALAMVNAFFLVRIFIIQHDCGHNSFFGSKKINNIVGFICSFFTSIPYKYWAKVHNFHHGHSGQLEVRNVGDIPFMTVKEYEEKKWWGKLLYRLWRTPVSLFVFAPTFYILISNRIPIFTLKNPRKMILDQLKNNFWITLAYVVLAIVVGWKRFLLVQFLLIFLFGVIAFWFFFVQHQHEEAYKKWKKDWNFVSSAIRGSTYYRLPRLFHWLTGNIGFQHVHHLSSTIPNYNLRKCVQENPILSKYVTKVNFRQSLKFMFYKLWDEEKQKMISFKEYSKKKKRVS